MLVELAIGDAYGGSFEHAYPSFVAEHNNLTGYVPHHGQPGAPARRYTDDTQMTIAIAEVLVSGLRWTPLLLAEQFVRAYHRDPHDGYAPSFHRLLSEVRDGEELLRRLRPQSDKSGAAMRAGPIRVLPTVDDVLYHAKLQARITHDTPAGIAAAQAAALAVHYCHHRVGPLSEIARWIEGILPEDVGHGGWALPWSGKVGPQGWMSVRAALTTLANGRSLSGMLLRRRAHRRRRHRRDDRAGRRVTLARGGAGSAAGVVARPGERRVRPRPPGGPRRAAAAHLTYPGSTERGRARAPGSAD